MGDEDTVISAIEMGACGYLHKGVDTTDVIDAIHQVFAGGSPLSPSIAKHLLRRLKRPTTVSRSLSDRLLRRAKPARQLTRREQEILQLVARGYLLHEVADELGISNHTVSNHNRNIYRKLSAHSRSEAVFKALSAGMLTSD
jgi:DNA-binding NarL/FixJ family response regulator